MDKQDIYQYYVGTGYSTDDTRKMLESTDHKGYDQAFDTSLTVFYYDWGLVVCGVGGLTFKEGL